MARKQSKTRAQRRSAEPPHSGSGYWIYGRHPVEAALANPERTVMRLVATEESARQIDGTLLTRPVSPEIMTRQAIDRLLGQSAVHQGLALRVAPLPERSLEDVVGDGPTVAVLDQVSDPHNVGAILRSAAVFGIGAVVVQDRHAPDATGALAKAASGAMEWVPVVRVTNLARALDDLKTHGYWLTGLDGQASQTLGDFPLPGPQAIILGAEGHGLRRLTRETCDNLLAIPHHRTDLSLNVSNAAAIAFYEMRRLVRKDLQTPMVNPDTFGR